MPKTDVIFFRDTDGSVPFLSWYDSLPETALHACTVKLDLLRNYGYDLRRSAADNLGGGIWELRAKANRINLRILYFFHGRHAVVVSHGFDKQTEINLAIQRKRLYERDPGAHTYQEKIGEGP